MNEKQANLALALNRRLKEINKFWQQACSDYQDLDEFLSSINALIQALRNLTFILQSNKDSIPGFDTWYIKKQEEMRKNELLSWLVDSRNRIVKQEDLKLKSVAKISIVNWNEQKLLEFDINPLLRPMEILIFIPQEEIKKILKDSRDGALKIERKWVIDTLPNYETLNALATCYLELKSIVKDSYIQAGISINTINELLDIEKTGFIKTKKVPDNDSVVFFDLKTNKPIKAHSKRFAASPSIKKKASIRYNMDESISSKPKDIGDPFEYLETMCKVAKNILTIDGNHIPLVHIFFKDRPPQIMTIPTADKTEQYVLMRHLGEIIHGKKATGMIFILEYWLSKNLDFTGKKGFPIDDPNKSEGLGITAIRQDGKYEVRYINFKKTKENQLVLTDFETNNNLQEANWLRPILDAWGIQANKQNL
jgi:hypothetical protein